MACIAVTNANAGSLAGPSSPVSCLGLAPGAGQLHIITNNSRLRPYHVESTGSLSNTEALKNYQAWKKRDVSSFKSDTIEDRRFFLVFAQIYCSKETPEALYERIESGSHSPNRRKVNAVLSNSKSFSETYNCPAESAMNPPNKCNIL
ncbi:unnamed protein product [Gordionus sp. m RMFG-2023]